MLTYVVERFWAALSELWDGYNLFLTIVAAIGFGLLLVPRFREWGARLMEWERIHWGWALAPVGLVVLFGWIKSGYEREKEWQEKVGLKDQQIAEMTAEFESASLPKLETDPAGVVVGEMDDGTPLVVFMVNVRNVGFVPTVITNVELEVRTADGQVHAGAVRYLDKPIALSPLDPKLGVMNLEPKAALIERGATSPIPPGGMVTGFVFATFGSIAGKTEWRSEAQFRLSYRDVRRNIHSVSCSVGQDGGWAAPPGLGAFITPTLQTPDAPTRAPG